ncbi:MAG: peptidylprolyl isomerase [Anaerolineales bacterium]|nr:MAG: peptidylprolyl isomerase [Anaerolineales bacterium]
MSETGQPTSVEDDVVVTLDYTLTVDGEIIDTSEEDGPIQFIQGSGHIVAGLERAIYGMQMGESKEFTISAADGYGEEDPEAIADIPRSEFPPEIPLEPGVELQLTDKEGDELEAYIVSVDKGVVRLNFNHPLAGKELHFSVEVTDLRSATPEELDHGHVHEAGHEH